MVGFLGDLLCRHFSISNHRATPVDEKEKSAQLAAGS